MRTVTTCGERSRGADCPPPAGRCRSLQPGPRMPIRAGDMPYGGVQGSQVSQKRSARTWFLHRAVTRSSETAQRALTTVVAVRLTIACQEEEPQSLRFRRIDDTVHTHYSPHGPGRGPRRGHGSVVEAADRRRERQRGPVSGRSVTGASQPSAEAGRRRGQAEWRAGAGVDGTTLRYAVPSIHAANCSQVAVRG